MYYNVAKFYFTVDILLTKFGGDHGMPHFFGGKSSDRLSDLVVELLGYRVYY